ncbi:MAG TPA: protein kinase, partial [Kofleriaceae bacterium]
MAAGTLGGRFEMIEFVAAGGLGYVFRGRDHSTGHDVAIKISRSVEQSVVERFAREARVLAALDHPAIVRYLGHGSHPEGAYVAMEWLEGEDLALRLKRQAPAIDEACALVARVAT